VLFLKGNFRYYHSPLSAINQIQTQYRLSEFLIHGSMFQLFVLWPEKQTAVELLKNSGRGSAFPKDISKQESTFSIEISSLLNLGKVENPQRSKLPQIEAKKPTLAKKDIRSRSSSVQSIDGEVTVEEFVLEMVKLPIDFEIFMILLLNSGIITYQNNVFQKMVKRKDGSHEVKEIQMKPLAGLTKEKLLRKASKKAA
jgi:hypothetical protein